MKKHNPSLPIMLREAQGTLPKVYARYDFGHEKSKSLEGTVDQYSEKRGKRKPPQSIRLSCWAMLPGIEIEYPDHEFG